MDQHVLQAIDWGVLSCAGFSHSAVDLVGTFLQLQDLTSFIFISIQIKILTVFSSDSFFKPNMLLFSIN